jgi:hypothetical protein
VSSIFTVAFRFPDGETVAQHRWNRGWSWWLHHPRMFSGDRDFVEAYLAEANAEDGETRCAVAPDGSGILVFDFLSGRILSMQTFAEFGLFSAERLMLAEAWATSRPLHATQFPDLIASGAIFEETIDGSGRVLESIRSPMISVSDLRQRAVLVKQQDSHYHKDLSTLESFMASTRRVFRISPSPLVLHELHPGRAEDVVNLRREMEASGFDLENCKAEWDDFRSYLASSTDRDPVIQRVEQHVSRGQTR